MDSTLSSALHTTNAVPLDLIYCSSEHDRTSHSSQLTNAFQLQQLLAEGDTTQLNNYGWESEQFCEYPQQLVFRVNHGKATCIDKLVILSHHSKVPSRIEIFTVIETISTTFQDWKKARFERLGYVAFQTHTDALVREMKTVPFPDEPLLFIKLLVHSCHVHVSNLYNQVELIMVVALGSPEDNEYENCEGEEDVELAVAMATLKRGSASKSLPSLSPLARSSPTKEKWDLSMLYKPYQSAPLLANSQSHQIWLPARQAYSTPLQILTRIQVAREREQMINNDGEMARRRRLDEVECKQLCEQLSILEKKDDDQLTGQSQLDEISRALQALDEKVMETEATQLALTPIRKVKSMPTTNLSCAFPEKAKYLSSEQWNEREEFVWRVCEVLQQHSASVEPVVFDEALEIIKRMLNDQHPQVFIAACSLLATVLELHKTVFQSTTLWKQEVTGLLSILFHRLDDVQAPIRNNAAYSIIKIAELTRARGTFVMHFLLYTVEQSGVEQITGQTVYGLVKIYSALLLSFHCCATIDISFKRIIRFMITADVFHHTSPHVREAGKELMLVLQGEVGTSVLIAYMIKKKVPSEIQIMLEQMFNAIEPASSTIPSNVSEHSLEEKREVID